MAINSVLMSHFLPAEAMTFSGVINEGAIFLIGMGIGVIANMHLKENLDYIEELKEDRLYLWNTQNKKHPLAENSFYRFGRYYTANVFAIRYRAHLFG